MKQENWNVKFAWLLTAVMLVLSAGLFVIPGMRFSSVLCLGIAGLSIIWLALNQLSEKHRFFKTCKAIFRYSLIAVFAVLCTLEGFVIRHGEQAVPDTPVDAVIVLGAGVNGETPSLALQTRIRAAAAYLAQHPDVPVVLSGGKGPGESITEAEAMRRALWTNSLERNALYFPEEQSTNTAENFRFSKEVLKQQGIDAETAVIAVVTNDFHMARAEVIAAKQGYGEIVGVPAELPWWWLNGNYYVREAFAMVKTLIIR